MIRIPENFNRVSQKPAVAKELSRPNYSLFFPVHAMVMAGVINDVPHRNRKGRSMIDSTITLYKLMILYLLEKAGFSMSNAMLADYMVGRSYTDFFRLQEVLTDMVGSKLLEESREPHTTWYEITDEGRQTLSYFDNDISPEIRSDITSYLKENGYRLRSESSVSARYRWTSDGGYEVLLSASEGNEELIRMTVHADTEETAILMCDNWKMKSADLYAALMFSLLGDADGKRPV